MARIVLGWELGANSGHARRLEMLAEALLSEGHELHLVVQNLQALHWTTAWAGRVTLWQAPLWSGLFRYDGAQVLGAPQRFGDLLGNLGLQSAQGFALVLRGWDALLSAIRPDAVIGDFAPGLMLAARGRVPRLMTGTGFTVPPSDLPQFPPFTDLQAAPLIAEPALLTLVNSALARLGWMPLDRLPQIMAAEVALPAVFAELDPYRTHRRAPPVAPFLPVEAARADLRDVARRPGVFAYLAGAGLTPDRVALLSALAAQVPVTAHLPGLAVPQAEALVRAGLRLLAQPLGWDAIARDHGLILCHGGMGTVSAALVAGVPLAVLPGGVEQGLTADALVAEGWGMALDPLGSNAADSLAAAAQSAAEASRACALAAHLRGRLHDPARKVADAVAAALAK